METWKYAAGIVVIVVLAFALYSLSQNNQQPTQGPTTTLAQAPTPTPGYSGTGAQPSIQPPVHSNEVVILHQTFTPPVISVASGTTVTWLNQDGTAYQFVLTGPQNATSGLIGGGQNYTFKFNIPGTYTFKESRYGITGQVNVA